MWRISHEFPVMWYFLLPKAGPPISRATVPLNITLRVRSTDMTVGRWMPAFPVDDFCKLVRDDFCKLVRLMDTGRNQNLLCVPESESCPLKIRAYFDTIRKRCNPIYLISRRHRAAHVESQIVPLFPQSLTIRVVGSVLNDARRRYEKCIVLGQ